MPFEVEDAPRFPMFTSGSCRARDCASLVGLLAQTRRFNDAMVAPDSADNLATYRSLISRGSPFNSRCF